MKNVATENLPTLDAQLLERLLSKSNYHFDLVEGTVFNQAGVRVIYLSTDLIRGIYEAVHFEAGEAWSVILKNCGYLWGKRIFDTLQKEVELAISQPLGKLAVPSFVNLVENYFAQYGWGKMTIHLQDAPQYGIVRVTMTHSLFVSALTNLEECVDGMIAGMLRGLFERISGQSLDCMEIACARRDAEPCVFLISAPKRISGIEHLVKDRVSSNDILAQLRQL
jgi:predicted hydrocarbon binding protein